MPFHTALSSLIDSESFLFYFWLHCLLTFNLCAGDDPICRGGQWPGVPGQWPEAAGEENQVGNHWRYNSFPFFSPISVPFLFFYLNLLWETRWDTIRQCAYITKEEVVLLWRKDNKEMVKTSVTLSVNKTMLHSVFRLLSCGMQLARASSRHSLSEEAWFIYLVPSSPHIPDCGKKTLDACRGEKLSECRFFQFIKSSEI